MSPIISAPFIGYFGDTKNNVYNIKKNQYESSRFKDLHSELKRINSQVTHLFFLKQTHSADVLILDENNYPSDTLSLFQHSGDAIITQKKQIGIGVLTADCVPVLLFDRKNKAIAAIHAGWRGLSKKIISETISAMQKAFHTEPSQLEAWIGPCAGVCCYEVQADLIAHFPETIFDQAIAQERDTKIFFDAPKAAYIELLQNKLTHEKIHSVNGHCTICVENYCSYRREKEKAGRQPSIAYLTD